MLNYNSRDITGNPITSECMKTRYRVLPGTQIGKMIRETALREWPLLAVSLMSNLFLALSEGITLIAIYQITSLLGSSNKLNFFHLPAIFTPLGNGLAALSRGQQFILLLFIAIALQIITGLARYVNGLAIGWFTARCQSWIRPKMHRHLLSLSYGCASSYSIGHLASVASRAPIAVQIQLMEGEQIISNLFLVVAYFIALLLLNPSLSIIAILMGLSIFWLQRTLQPLIQAASKKQAELYLKIASGMTEDLQLLRLLHSTAGMDISVRRLVKRSQELEGHIVRLNYLLQLFEPVGDLLPVLAAAAIGGMSWLMFKGNGQLLVPNLITFLLVIQRLNIRFSRLGVSLNRIAENSATMQEVEAILDPTDKQFRRIGGSPYGGFKRSIQFKEISLFYPDRSKPSLSNINLKILFGSKIALVGESGAGKSSIVDLLVGLYNPTMGSILVDGTDLQTINLDDWQKYLGVVSQDVLLVNGSIRDNIAFGLPDATTDQIRDAARAADADSFIVSLPEQYETLIGERGFRLSGGQRQRLSLARALLKKPQLLILDEATSSLDSLSEARILKTIDNVTQNMTVISVAHRLSSVCHADEIVVLDGGHIKERGKHADLMQLEGFYAALWKRQADQTVPS